ncbi:MAG: TolC family protein [Oligoflexia bacterium]|nr:TolC family protein [Oligoflexia bacterium]
MKKLWTVIIFLTLFADGLWAKAIDLSSAINLAIKTHPAIEAAEASFNSERLAITPLYFPENPKIGIMSENSKNSWTIAQELSFPTKYYYRGLVQKQRSLSLKEDLVIKKLQIRARVIVAYYGIFQKEKTIGLLKEQRDLLKEIARIAESRRTVGQLSIQDEMRAHLEQAKMENDILVAEQDKTTVLAQFAELLATEEKIGNDKLGVPKLTKSSNQLKSISYSIPITDIPSLKSAYLKVGESLAQKDVAKSSYWPDLGLSYQKSLENGNDDKKITVELKIPFWFWGKENNEVNSAAEKVIVSHKNLEVAKRELQFNLRSLSAKILAKENILKLYETTLIPQGVSTINSARAAYKAGRVGFLELLDSERTVYNLRITYYQELKDYSEAIAEFETNSGQSISSLPFENIL